MTTLAELVAHLGARALADEAEALAHATDFLDLACTVVVAWQWLRQATAATRALAEGRGHAGFLRGKLAAAACFFDAELPRVAALDHRCRHDRSYLGVDPQWL